MAGIGSNTNAPAGLLSSDCLLLIGEDPATAEALLTPYFGVPSACHSFRGYVFQKRDRVTTIFSGMGTACVEPLLWEMRSRVTRLVLLGTAGSMPRGKAPAGAAYIITTARAAGTGMDAIGLPGVHRPRWNVPTDLPAASIVSTDFYYGFTAGVGQSSHPLHRTSLPKMFAESTEDLVDMEVAAFYGLCVRIMPISTQYVAIKSPANPAGIGDEHLGNTPRALSLCIDIARRLLAAK